MKFYFIFLFVFLFPFVNAVTLSMSPQQINFEGNVGEKICNQINLKTEGKAMLIGETNWAEKNYFERKLKSHNLSAKELGLNMYYPLEIEIYENETIDVCITGKKAGGYHGVILYRVIGKPVRVGIWMNVTLEGNNNLLKINGNSIIGEKGDSSNIFIGLTFFLLLIFLGLVWKSKKLNLSKSRKKQPFS